MPAAAFDACVVEWGPAENGVLQDFLFPRGLYGTATTTAMVVAE
jgi:hypothetical protein